MSMQIYHRTLLFCLKEKKSFVDKYDCLANRVSGASLQFVLRETNLRLGTLSYISQYISLHTNTNIFIF